MGLAIQSLRDWAEQCGTLETTPAFSTIQCDPSTCLVMLLSKNRCRIYSEVVSTLSLVTCKPTRGLLRAQLTKQWGFLGEEKLCWRISSNLATLMPLVPESILGAPGLGQSWSLSMACPKSQGACLEGISSPLRPKSQPRSLPGIGALSLDKLETLGVNPRPPEYDPILWEPEHHAGGRNTDACAFCGSVRMLPLGSQGYLVPGGTWERCASQSPLES